MTQARQPRAANTADKPPRAERDPEIIKLAANPEAIARHPLVGAGVHYKDEHGRIRHQAAILAVFPSNCATTGDLVLLQVFAWVMGGASTQRVLPLIEMASSERWVIYQSTEEMNAHYRSVDSHQDGHINRRLEAAKAAAVSAGTAQEMGRRASQ